MMDRICLFHGKNRTCIRRILSFTICLCLIFSVPANVQAKLMERPKDLRSHHAFAVIDAKSGKLLMADHGTDKIYPASTVKLMTTAVILEQMKKKHISINHKVKITSAMIKQVPKGVSSYGLKAGKTYTLSALLHMTLMISAGDATICSGVYVFGSTKKCLNAMNKKCEKLALTHTKFDNLVGLDIGDSYNKTYSTAVEVAKMTKYAMKNSTIRKIVAKEKYRVKQTDGSVERTIRSTNCFFSTVSYPEDKYRIIGAKSGTTKAAGKVFTAVAVDENNHEVVCTYMGTYSRQATFEDIRTIFNTVFDASRKKQISLSGETKHNKGKK